MTSQGELLLLAVIALGAADALWIVIGWLADRHLTATTKNGD
ncbi:hypothetical protein [Streptomyces sp. NPDC048438]